jgi:endo-1,4-beta-xylanase
MTTTRRDMLRLLAGTAATAALPPLFAADPEPLKATRRGEGPALRRYARLQVLQ